MGGVVVARSIRVGLINTGLRDGTAVEGTSSSAAIWRRLRAFAPVELPLHLNWFDRGRRFDLRDRRQRARVYELVLREGRPVDVLTYLDGALLLDVWNELVLPVVVRAAWKGVVTT
jgi:hypothetical protein